jgi:hypothetical protein
MREGPPPQLTSLLERLGLACAAQVARMEPQVRRLAKDLPRFESVWIDALVRGRILTPFQAAQLNAGRGEGLAVGPYLLCQPAPTCHYVPCYRARRRDSADAVHLAVVEDAGPQTTEMLRQLEALASKAEKLRTDCSAAITAAGIDGRRVWAASPWIEGRTAAEWIVRHGRFPAEAVLEIARAMAETLAALEANGLCHGDICASGLLLTGRAQVVLPQPGLRGVLRPEEGYGSADLCPEAYDGLAPERVALGTPPTIASDMFSCGCLWWHLLCGRTPLPAGDSVAKLRRAQIAQIDDVRGFAPDVPGTLAAAIAACVEREPQQRPASMAALAAMLGPRRRNGQRALARCLAGCATPAVAWPEPARSRRSSVRTPQRLTAAAIALLILAAVFWPIWSSLVRQQGLAANGVRPEAAEPDPAVLARAPVPEEKARIDNARPPSIAKPRDVIPAAYDTPYSPDVPHDLVLPSDQPLAAEVLSLKPGQRVRPQRGKRAKLLVPPAGLAVAVDNVRFDNVDFAWRPSNTGRSDDPQPAAMVRLCAGRADFHGCTFQPRGTEEKTPSGTGGTSWGTQPKAALPVAIYWTHPANPDKAVLSLPSGRVRMSNCVFRGVAAALDCHTLGALGIELVNGLHLGPGPLVRLDHAPTADEPVRITVSQVTVRDASAFLQCRCERHNSDPGTISIEAIGSVLAPSAGDALLLLTAPQSPAWPLKGMKWTGQGTLLVPEAAVALWRCPGKEDQWLDDSLISMAGLVRSSVEFAGPAKGPQTASRILRWQAPLQSADPPGVDVDVLPKEDVLVPTK